MIKYLQYFSTYKSLFKMEPFELLIIGAGAAGIAAASKLLECGFKNFKILEAENRIGGRINTVKMGIDSVELGAEWVHGENDNIVFELASKYDLVDNSPPKFHFENTKFYDLSGHQVNEDISRALIKVYHEIMKTDGEDLNEEILNGSVGHYFEIEFQKKINELSKKINIDVELSKKFLKTFENWENSIDASHSWYETSLCGHLEYWECDGNQLTTWKNNSYETIFKLLTKKIPNPKKELPVCDKILFNKEVVKITWNKECKINTPKVKVECLDGSLYFAKQILITCSLGVLQERALKLFVPCLPNEKLKCIQNLGFGTVDKIFVKFNHRWWEDNIDGFGFLWSAEERSNDSSGWLNGVICFHPINSTSPILRGWVTGEAAQHMESLSEHEVTQGINHLFDRFLGSQFCIPSAEICLFSRWYTNPHFRGSYSCRLLKSEQSNVWASQLAEPVCDVKGQPILFFGGEATHDHYFSTVHGAIESGQREAARLLPIMNDCKNKKYQVIIVGAGISGLSAAKTLLENNISDVIILEAQSKPGGRIQSLQVGEYCLELGAQWIHGEKNEVFRICKDNDLLTDEYSDEGQGLYLRENGEQVNEDLVKEVDDVIKDILENCENYILHKSKNYIPQSIGQELLLKFDEYLNSCTSDTEETKRIKKELFDWHIRFQLIDNSCFDLYNLSARAWGLFKFCGGNDYVNFKNGYSSLINVLVGYLPKNMISFDTVVQHIEWKKEIDFKEECVSNNGDSNYCVKVTCNNGLTYFSQYVIVTCSLGFLKNNYKDLFIPSLPPFLSEAIEFLDFGVINKLFLIYKKPWWDLSVKGFQLVWTRAEAARPEEKWGRYVTGFDVIIKNKPVLLGWVGGEGAKIIEELPEKQLGLEATLLLRKFTKNSNIPLPEKVITTKWWSNKYVKGAYSHITVKCDKTEVDCSTLACPVFTKVHKDQRLFEKPTVLLAGESTHKNHFSTVHGAYESGQTQAQIIVADIKKDKINQKN